MRQTRGSVGPSTCFLICQPWKDGSTLCQTQVPRLRVRPLLVAERVGVPVTAAADATLDAEQSKGSPAIAHVCGSGWRGLRVRSKATAADRVARAGHGCCCWRHGFASCQQACARPRDDVSRVAAAFARQQRHTDDARVRQSAVRGRDYLVSELQQSEPRAAGRSHECRVRPSRARVRRRNVQGRSDFKHSQLAVEHTHI